MDTGIEDLGEMVIEKPGISVGTGGIIEIEEPFPMSFQEKRRTLLWNVIDLNCQIFTEVVLSGGLE